MIPLSDDNVTLKTPLVTLLLLALLAAVWVFIQAAGLDPVALAASVCNYGLVPAELTHRAPLGTSVPIGPGLRCIVDNDPINGLTPLTSMFLHGSWGHLIGNALFLWAFGKSVEDSMGRVRYLVFYLLTGLAAATTQVGVNAASAVPMVGASGAISGIMGAYLVLYPRARIRMLFVFFIFIRIIPVSAWIVLIYWFATQVLLGLPALSSVDPEVSMGVAVWAHIGGFVAGAVLAKFFARPDLVAMKQRLKHGFGF